jgi:GAF domain-containing protein
MAAREKRQAMLTWIRHFLAAPVFDDSEKTRISQLLNDMLLAILGMSLVAAIAIFAISPASFLEDWYSPLIIAAIVVAALILRVLLHRGHTVLTSVLLSLTFLLVVAFASYKYGGITNSITGGYLLCIIMAGLLLGGRGAMAFTALTVIAVIGTWYLWSVGLLKYDYIVADEQNFGVIAYSVMFIIGGLLLRYAADSIAQAMDRVRRKEEAEAQANRELRQLRDSLEQQVAERTQALQRRAVQLQAAAEVGRTVIAVLEADQLVQQIVELVRRRFEMHTVGLYLTDPSGKWAVLQASDGATGQSLVKDRVSLSDDSIISQCIAKTQTHVSENAVQVPGARSVAALPLLSRERVYGALALYSDQPDTFDQDTRAILESVADQVAIALDNARLFATSRAALEDAQRAYGQLSRQAWADLARARGLGRRKSQSGTFVVAAPQTTEAHTALQTGQTVQQPENHQELAAPIKVREQTIGVIDARKPAGSGQWTSEEIRLLEALAEQLGVALESARLYQDTQRRAARESILREISDRMQRAPDMQSLMRITTEELNKALGASRTYVRLGTEALPSSNGDEPSGEGGD